MAISAKHQKSIIQGYYQRFHHPRFLEWDPLCVVREFQSTRDCEWVALMGAIFAFGGVRQIIASVKSALSMLEIKAGSSSMKPWVEQFGSGESEKAFAERTGARIQEFRHRIYVGDDLLVLALLYRRSFLQHGSLQKHFLQFHSPQSETVEEGLSGLISEYRAWIPDLPVVPGRFFSHMLNSPAQKSACKRWLMFLKWMVRKEDGIDMGLWCEEPACLRADQLVIPLDTHLFNISKKLGLTRRKMANWVTAIEVTRNLRKIDADDPTKFDFALCRWGMFDYRKLLDQTGKNTPGSS